MRFMDWFSRRKSFGSRTDLNIPINEARYVVIDTELTGLDKKKDSIISIGAIRMIGGRIELGDSFYKLVSPETELTKKTVVIHGITPSDVKEKPQIKVVLPEFLNFCGQDVIVGFHSVLDLSFINKETVKLYSAQVKNPVVDIFAVYRWIKWRSGDDCSKNPSLYEIAKEFDIAVKGAHNALSDAFITAQIFQRLLYLLFGLGIKSVGELLDVSNPTKGGDKFRSFAKINNL